MEDFHGISPGPSQATDSAAQAPRLGRESGKGSALWVQVSLLFDSEGMFTRARTLATLVFTVSRVDRMWKHLEVLSLVLIFQHPQTCRDIDACSISRG